MTQEHLQEILTAPMCAVPRYTTWYRYYRDTYATHYTKHLQPGKGRPLVTVCVLTDTVTTRQYVGYSICGPWDMPEKRLGRYIARARAEKACRLGIPFHIYRQGLGKVPREVLAACGLGRCAYPATEEAGDWLCIPLGFVDGDAGDEGAP